MSKKVLILGGAGFIGFNITKYLAENRDYELTIADNFMKKNLLFHASKVKIQTKYNYFQ